MCSLLLLRKGLKKCIWIGRNEIIQRNGVTYYLDCAHTIDGMKSCAEWFKAMTSLDERCAVAWIVSFSPY